MSSIHSWVPSLNGVLYININSGLDLNVLEQRDILTGNPYEIDCSREVSNLLHLWFDLDEEENTVYRYAIIPASLLSMESYNSAIKQAEKGSLTDGRKLREVGYAATVRLLHLLCITQHGSNFGNDVVIVHRQKEVERIVRAVRYTVEEGKKCLSMRPMLPKALLTAARGYAFELAK